VTLLFVLLWRPDTPGDNVHIAVAGLMAMTWGDALATVIGRRFGKHQYQIGNSVRSWEGSAVMLITSTTAIFLVLLFLSGSTLSPLAVSISVSRAFWVALIIAIVATLAEAVSLNGTDNLSVPLLTAATTWVILQI
jgi:phytol kinase